MKTTLAEEEVKSKEVINMFYCDTCAKRKGWQTGTINRSVGLCEICKCRGLCNDVPSRNLPIPRDEWIIVESQAGAGSLYEVWPAHNINNHVVDRVTELRNERIRFHIYKVQTVEELTFVPASIHNKEAIPICGDDPGNCLTGGACPTCQENDKEDEDGQDPE